MIVTIYLLNAYTASGLFGRNLSAPGLDMPAALLHNTVSLKFLMKEDLFKLDTKQGEEELLNIKKLLEEEPEAAKFLREEIKARVVYVMQESKEISQLMHKRIDEITKSSGISLREICDRLIGLDDDDSDDFAEYRDDEFEYDEAPDDSDQAMPTQTITGPILPPDEIGPSPEFSFSYGIPRSLNDQPRIAKLKEILKELGISEADCMRYEENTKENDKKQPKRKNPYEIIAIPELEKIILICDKAGNATYIARAKPEEAEKYCRMRKRELRDNPNVEFLPWKYVGDWKLELKNILISNSSKAYFKAGNAARIKSELMAFAATIRGGIDVRDLPDWNFPGKTIVDQDGKELRADNYIERAALEMGMVRNNIRIPRYEVLTKLLKLAGIE